jgi:hypothetical protein
MRKLLTLVVALSVILVAAGFASAIAASGIVVEETLVLGEHTIKGKTIDLAGAPDDFKPGDRYIFRSELSQAGDVVGYLYVDCSVHFAHRDSCSQIYDIATRGSVVAEGLVPASQLHLGGTWTLAITGGTGDFENVRGSVEVVIVNDSGDSEHTLDLLP